MRAACTTSSLIPPSSQPPPPPHSLARFLHLTHPTCTHVPPVVEEKIVGPAVDQRGGLSRDQWNAVLVDGEVLVRQHDLVIGKGGGGAEEQGEEEG